MLPNYSTVIIAVIKLHYHGKIHIVKFSLRCNSTMIRLHITDVWGFSRVTGWQHTLRMHKLTSLAASISLLQNDLYSPSHKQPGHPDITTPPQTEGQRFTTTLSQNQSLPFSMLIRFNAQIRYYSIVTLKLAVSVKLFWNDMYCESAIFELNGFSF